MGLEYRIRGYNIRVEDKERYGSRVEDKKRYGSIVKNRDMVYHSTSANPLPTSDLRQIRYNTHPIF